jgi:hypothetical protein
VPSVTNGPKSNERTRVVDNTSCMVRPQK